MTTRTNRLGELASSFLATVKGFPDAETFALLERAMAKAPSPQTVEIA
jgi:hypothetical protein